MAVHQVCVGPLPRWLDARRLLGPTARDDPDARGWELEVGPDGALEARAGLDGPRAADLAARLRNLGFDGRAIACTIEPPLSRALVRRARTEDARRRRATTPGFERAGVRLDDVGRMSLTPELLALKIAGWAEGRPVIDATCGLGGNAIAFARMGCRVRAIELDEDRLALARHNAGVYGVGDRIEFCHGDARELLAARPEPEAIVLVDPPWGADWDRRSTGLAELPLLAELIERAEQLGHTELWAKLPLSFRTADILGDRRGEARALFGEAQGDRRRVKFVLVRCALAVQRVAR